MICNHSLPKKWVIVKVKRLLMSNDGVRKRLMDWYLIVTWYQLSWGMAQPYLKKKAVLSVSLQTRCLWWTENEKDVWMGKCRIEWNQPPFSTRRQSRLLMAILKRAHCVCSLEPLTPSIVLHCAPLRLACSTAFRLLHCVLLAPLRSACSTALGMLHCVLLAPLRSACSTALGMLHCVLLAPLHISCSTAFRLLHCVPLAPLRLACSSCLLCLQARLYCFILFILLHCVPLAPLRSACSTAFRLLHCVPLAPLRSACSIAFPLLHCAWLALVACFAFGLAYSIRSLTHFRRTGGILKPLVTKAWRHGKRWW